jgi:hypothetical protein
MLHEFLKTIQDDDVQSLLEIACTLRISQTMALQVVDDLTRKGYLQEMSVDCGTPHKGCSDCSVGSKCQRLSRHWFLTEKGRAAIS